MRIEIVSEMDDKPIEGVSVKYYYREKHKKPRSEFLSDVNGIVLFSAETSSLSYRLGKVTITKARYESLEYSMWNYKLEDDFLNQTLDGQIKLKPVGQNL